MAQYHQTLYLEDECHGRKKQEEEEEEEKGRKEETEYLYST